MKKSIMVIAAHPDDEVLGCGGTIAKHIKNGDEVHCLILTKGIASRDLNKVQKKTGLNRIKKSIRKAHLILGTSSVKVENFPDNSMDSVKLLNIVKTIEKYISKYKPEIVYTHYGADVNIDHKITSQAVVAACRPLTTMVKTILFFEVLSSTEWQIGGEFQKFSPNWFIDISATLNEKIESLQSYDGEIRTWPHSRSVEGVKSLAHFRGCSAGIDAAEAFCLGRHIEFK
jgi:N-acetylglucosamine malate deacetylase 1